MTDTHKPKRKNAPPTRHRYWWIFSTLAIVLLIGLRYPVRILSIWALNPLLYALIALGCLIAAACLAKTISWRQPIISLMLACTLLSGWQVFVSANQAGVNTDLCQTYSNGLLTYTNCSYIGNCPTLLREYASLGDIRIGIELLDYYHDACGLPRWDRGW